EIMIVHNDSTGTTRKRVGGLLLRSLELLSGEALVRAGWATYLSYPLLGRYRSRLYLTDQRLCFLPLRWGFSSSSIAPLAGRPLIVPLDQIDTLGAAPAQIRFMFWEESWYVKSNRYGHYCATVGPLGS